MAKLDAPWSEGWRPCLGDIPRPFVCQMHGQIASEHVSLGAAARTVVSQSPRATQIELWAIVDSGLRDSRLHEVVDDAVRLLSRGAWPSVPLWRDAATRIGSFLELSGTAPDGGP